MIPQAREPGPFSERRHMFRYSPLQIENYRLPGMKTCEVRSIEEMPEPDKAAVWNLFWLSIPDIDTVPGSGKRWFKTYTPVAGATGAIVRDVLAGIRADALEDPVMYYKVRLHPRRFIEWFEREDHTIYDSYYVLGGPKWVSTVLTRAERAKAHLLEEFRPAPNYEERRPAT